MNSTKSEIAAKSLNEILDNSLADENGGTDFATSISLGLRKRPDRDI